MRNVQNPFKLLAAKGDCFRKNLGENQKDIPALVLKSNHQVLVQPWEVILGGEIQIWSKSLAFFT
jgi:hypothetical protein